MQTSNVLARTWYIKADGTGDAATIQAGVDSAAVGDTVLVGPGVYADTQEIVVDGVSRIVNVHVYKDIRIIGDDSTPKPTIDGPASNIGVYVEHTGSESELSGLSVSTEFMVFGCIEGIAVDAPQPDFQVAILCDRSSIVITNNEIVDNGIAIRLQHSSAHISDNVISRSMYGITCEDTSDATIICNTISECGTSIDCYRSSPAISLNDISMGCDGISCRIDSHAVISQNNIHSIEVLGVAVLNSDVVVEDNSFSIGEIGLAAQGDCGGLRVSGNLFYRHKSSAMDFLAVPSAVVEYNTIDSVDFWAISLQGSHPTFRNNIITRAPIGMRCLLGSSPYFECNDLYAISNAYIGDCSDQTGLNGNISLDPEFCGVDDSGNYYLQSDSPCAPGNHPDGYDCGIIGAFVVNCKTVDAQQRSWGNIKSLYR